MRARHYFLLLSLTVTVGMAFGSFVQTITDNFGCRTKYYSDSDYLAYCENAKFGSYEHSAMWFGLENDLGVHVTKAKVIFLGNSRTQFAFSTKAVRKYFEERGIPFYVMGFTWAEGSPFGLALLKRWKAKPSIIVINTDPWFKEAPSPVAQEVINGYPPVLWRTGMKMLFQRVQRNVCSLAPQVCPEDTKDIFRSSLNGMWSLKDTSLTNPGPFLDPETAIQIPFGKDVVLDPEQLQKARSIGADFIASVGLDPSCIVLTGTPTIGMEGPAFAAELSKALGTRLILPDVSNLATLDNSHLNSDSAERWSNDFLVRLTPLLEKCL